MAVGMDIEHRKTIDSGDDAVVRAEVNTSVIGNGDDYRCPDGVGETYSCSTKV